MKRAAWLLSLLLCALPLRAATIDRVEPANWWVGMQHRQVELMLYGRDIAALQARKELRDVDSNLGQLGRALAAANLAQAG